MSARLLTQYIEQIRPQLMKESGYTNIMSVPRVSKIVVNSGVGEASKNKEALENVLEILEKITGQKPVATKAKRAISVFQIRQGMEIGAMVTLRGDRMWEFLDKLINVVLPRTRDFRGTNANAFDKAGNYSLGIREHMVFPEIDPNKVQKIRPLQVVIVTTAKNKEESMQLLSKFGFPFAKDVNRS
ncbi:50S ribosomal protein L5 [Candidatus Dojkabacteria bacterium]|jgi:large subunit ribosomal protein L5|nr:50S ribosomal protein L5 [Candidatus Dojkabacteria bacterium]